MKSHPILFSGDMVRAILEGCKTQTRRPIKSQPFVDDNPMGKDLQVRSVAFDAERGDWEFLSSVTRHDFGSCQASHRVKCPYGVPGDELYVRESYRFEDKHDAIAPSAHPWKQANQVRYEAGMDTRAQTGFLGPVGKLRPSILMPKWASRIHPIVTDVRIQRLMDASEADTIAEGFANSAGYQSAMMKAYGDGITYANPWVWAITFEVRP